MQLYKTAFVLSLLIFGVGSFTRPTTAAAEKIHASYGATNGSMAATWIAKEAALFKQQELDVSLAKSMLSFLSRSNPEAKNANPEGFIEPRFIKELEASGFLTELSRKYPIKQKRGD